MLTHSPPALPGHRALCKGRCSKPGQIYLVTTVVLDRNCIFADGFLATTAARLIADPGLWRGSQLLCWVLMPDHLHAVVELGYSETLEQLFKRVKSVIAQAINRERNTTGVIWGRAFHDHALRHEDDLLAIARYIIANPVRSGLVARVGDYPFWNAIWLSP